MNRTLRHRSLGNGVYFVGEAKWGVSVRLHLLTSVLPKDHAPPPPTPLLCTATIRNAFPRDDLFLFQTFPYQSTRTNFTKTKSVKKGHSEIFFVSIINPPRKSKYFPKLMRSFAIKNRFPIKKRKPYSTRSLPAILTTVFYGQRVP